MSAYIEHKNIEKEPFSQRLTARKFTYRIKIVVLIQRVIKRTIKILSQWINRSRQRKSLATLDERMLADIGYSAAQARKEFSKPFWK